ncbi:MAG: polysaccharide deacetylase family protein [Ferruginibacter sp.]
MPADTGKHFHYQHGAITRGDTASKKMSIVFTGDEFADGGSTIIDALAKENIKASFFFTGRFYGNKKFENIIHKLKKNGHYLGAHSNEHLLYCDWEKRDSLLVSHEQFNLDLQKNYERMKSFGIAKRNARYFLPPYEWYNDSIALWTKQQNLQLINFSPGTNGAADYTWPELKNFRNSESIFESIETCEARSTAGLNGFILLLHIGTDPRRIDKFYYYLPQLLRWLKEKGYQPVKVDELLEQKF